MLSKKIETIIIFLYTFLVLKVVYPFLFYAVPNNWGKFSDTVNEFVSLNNNLMALCIGIFLNAVLILYFKPFAEKKYEAIVLAIYTLVNLKLLSTPFLHFFTSYGGTIIYSQYVPGFNLLAVFIGLFLNTALTIYWVRKNTI